MNRTICLILTILLLAGLASCRSAQSVVTGFSIDSALPQQRMRATKLPRGYSAPHEILVIERRTHVAMIQPDSAPGLHAIVDEKEIALPLKHTAYEAKIAGAVSSVRVQQQYHNPHENKIEAVYVFPLPTDAAVTDFLMTVGKRTIRGIIREKKEAERIYKAAKQQGYRAALLTQERPNVFTQKVANIEPGHDIDIDLTYFHLLTPVAGQYEFVLPTVVGPRYNPPGFKAGISAVAQGGSSNEHATSVNYLRPGTTSAHDISVHVEIESGLPLREVSSPSHSIDVTHSSPASASVTLSPNDRLPDKDFILRFRPDDSMLQTALLTEQKNGHTYFSLIVQPPKELAQQPRLPRELIFVLDCSGSMSGKPMKQAKAFARRCLRELRPGDSFQIIRFSSDASSLGTKPVPADSHNIKRGIRYLDGLKGSGGTHMLAGIESALCFPHEEGLERIVCFLTDGYIGNEAQVFGAVAEHLGQARIFSVGVGSSVNRHLLEGLARFGHGKALFVGLNDGVAAGAERLFEQAGQAAFRDLFIDWGEGAIQDVYPKKLPPVYIGEPLLLFGRTQGALRRNIAIHGWLGTERHTLRVQANALTPVAHSGIASMWARSRIREISDALVTTQEPGLKEDLLATSLEHRVLCDLSAFVAVDSLAPTTGAEPHTVNVAVPVPEGVSYETTVAE